MVPFPTANTGVPSGTAKSRPVWIPPDQRVPLSPNRAVILPPLTGLVHLPPANKGSLTCRPPRGREILGKGIPRGALVAFPWRSASFTTCAGFLFLTAL